MDNRWLFVKLLLVICLIGVVIGADKVKKRDVHHMIVVRGARKPRSNRHTHHHPHHKHRGKRHRHHHHHHHHRHHLHDDSVEDGGSLFDSHEYSYEDTSKYQPHRHKSKHHSHHYDFEESQLGDDLTPPISLDMEDFHYKQPKHKYNKRHSHKHKKRHNTNHRNRYNDAPKFPQIDLTTSYPMFYENFPPYDGFGSFNQKFIDSDRSPIIKTDGMVLNPDLLKLDNYINRYEVKENVNENVKNQSSFQILAPIFNADNLSTEETKTEKTVEDQTPVTTTTHRPRIRSRGNVKPRKNLK